MLGDLSDVGVAEESEVRDAVGDIDEQKLQEHICSSATLVYSFAQLRVYLLPEADTEVSRVFSGLTDRRSFIRNDTGSQQPRSYRQVPNSTPNPKLP